MGVERRPLRPAQGSESWASLLGIQASNDGGTMVGVLSDTERMKLAYSAVHGRGSLTEAEINLVTQWAIQAKVNAAALELLLDGKIDVTVDPSGEILFQPLDPEAELAKRVLVWRDIVEREVVGE